THGRSIWILDNIAPLRELVRLVGGPHLFRPPRTTRVRWNLFLDTPLPPDEPTGENPPDGAIFDYHLPANASMVTLEVIDGGNVVRKYSSDDVSESIDPTSLRHPTYWIRSPQSLSTEPGHHRFVWDLRYEPPRGAERSFSISAVHERTPSSPQGPFVPPGTYDIRLTVDGSVLESTLEVRLDPRVEMTPDDVRLQTESSLACYDGYLELQTIREAIDARVETLDGARRDAWMALRGRGAPSEPDTLYGSIYESPPAEETVVGLQQKFLYLLKLLQDADARPTSQALDAVERLRARSRLLGDRWVRLKSSN
ncbi:MAG TPA: glycoside hydrolase, partial [Vicinamibacteria bacterium]|nr:glycoside hydrolase [Vicinamibacteria bacterium]